MSSASWMAAFVVLVSLAPPSAADTLQKPLPLPRPVVTEIIAQTPQSERSVPGVITARREVTLGFQTLGPIIARLVEVGDTVVEGQQLASINPDDLAGDVIAATAAVDAALVRLNTASSTAERTRQLAQRKIASTAQMEQVENALTSAQAVYAQARSELVRARDAESFAHLVAPFDGVISAVFADVGAIVSAGQPVLQLSAVDDLEAVIDLPDTALVGLAPGHPYQVWSENNKDHPIDAELRMIGPFADAATRTRRVHLALFQDQGLRLGALIRAHPAITGDRVMTIPLGAIRYQDGQPHVWVVQTENDQRLVHLRPITIVGPAIGNRITVMSGLQDGDEIVIRGVNSLTEAQPVGMGLPS